MPTRKDMEEALARRFGFPDYDTFKREAAQTLGKGLVNRLEKSLDKYGPAESVTGPTPPPGGAPGPALGPAPGVPGPAGPTP